MYISHLDYKLLLYVLPSLIIRTRSPNGPRPYIIKLLDTINAVTEPSFIHFCPESVSLITEHDADGLCPKCWSSRFYFIDKGYGLYLTQIEWQLREKQVLYYLILTPPRELGFMICIL